MYSISAGGSVLTLIGTVGAGTGPQSVTVDPSGMFAYVANGVSNNVSMYTISNTTGALTSIAAPVAAGPGPLSVTVDPSGGFVYDANDGSNPIPIPPPNTPTRPLPPIGATYP